MVSSVTPSDAKYSSASSITRRAVDGVTPAGLAVERRHPVTVCNIQTDTSGDVRPGAKATGLEGAIALPMLRGDEVAGVLGVANRAERTFTGEETELLLAIGRLLAERGESS